MQNKKEIYAKRKFLFYCRGCRDKHKERKAFKFVNCQRPGQAVLRCCDCELLVTRSLKSLDKQIKEGKK